MSDDEYLHKARDALYEFIRAGENRLTDHRKNELYDLIVVIEAYLDPTDDYDDIHNIECRDTVVQTVLSFDYREYNGSEVTSINIDLSNASL